MEQQQQQQPLLSGTHIILSLFPDLSLSLSLQDKEPRAILFNFVFVSIGNDNGAESWRSYQYLERSTSLHIPTGQELVSGEEVRLASNFSGSDRFSAYPPSIHGALISSPEPPPLPFPHPPSHGKLKLQIPILHKFSDT